MSTAKIVSALVCGRPFAVPTVKPIPMHVKQNALASWWSIEVNAASAPSGM